MESPLALGRLLQKALLTFSHMIKMGYRGVFREMGLNPSLLMYYLCFSATKGQQFYIKLDIG